jgi:hypothetical protein
MSSTTRNRRNLRNSFTSRHGIEGVGGIAGAEPIITTRSGSEKRAWIWGSRWSSDWSTASPAILPYQKVQEPTHLGFPAE